MPRLPETGIKLRLPQVRVLYALSDEDNPFLTRQKVCQRCGFSETSGTINSSLHGVPEGSSSGPARPGLLPLGLVERQEIDVDGLVELSYRITQKGRRVLAEHLKELGGLPELRDKEVSTNRRYRKEQDCVET